eukprot:g17376.t1
MIDHLKQMAVFARVVDEGSFRAAARDLNLAPSRISEMVSDLEAYLGVTLLYRSTRKIALTSEGRIFYASVVEMLHSAEAGLNELNALSVEPAGALAVSVPSFMASSALSAAMASFMRQHPLVSLSLTYTDRPVGLMDDGYDVNIRVGWLDDSSLMARKLGEEDRVLVAGTHYAASQGRPEHPRDLEDWDWIRYEQRAEMLELTPPRGKAVKLRGASRLQVDSIEALYTFTCQNLGVTALPQHLARRGIEAGELVQLLPEWKLRPLGFFAVWPDKSRRESLTLLYVRYLAENFAP